ncbi:MAG: hypothetical protein IPK99_17000 [Flavobacteriales bacterium]|nr:hypothetical protein [Flavobacteriales bacterium]
MDWPRIEDARQQGVQRTGAEAAGSSAIPAQDRERGQTAAKVWEVDTLRRSIEFIRNEHNPAEVLSSSRHGKIASSSTACAHMQHAGCLLLLGGFSHDGTDADAGSQLQFISDQRGAGVSAMALQPDGRILCGGGFSQYDGVVREDIVRLQPDGAVDMGFSAMSITGTGASVQAFALQPDGRILVGGAFAEMNGNPCLGLTRLLANGTTDPSFSHGLDGYFFSAAVTPNSNVFVGGDIFSPGVGIMVLDANGNDVATPPLVPSTQCLRAQPDGRVLVGLSDAPYMARSEQNGTVDASFTPNIMATFGALVDMALLADGRIVVVGRFNTVDGQPRANIARLLPDGSLDPSFDPGLGFDGPVFSVDTLPGGDVLVAGSFTSYNGVPANGNLLRINADGTLDVDFVASGIMDIVVQPDGGVLLSGALMTFAGAFRNGVMRLMPDLGTTISESAMTETRIWPNPARRSLNLEGIHGRSRYWITDATGRTIATGEMNSPVLDVEELPAGFHVLHISNTAGSYQGHFIKEEAERRGLPTQCSVFGPLPLDRAQALGEALRVVFQSPKR